MDQYYIAELQYLRFACIRGLRKILSDCEVNSKNQLLLLATPVDKKCTTCLSPRRTRPVKVLLSVQEAQTREAAEMWPDRSDGNSQRERESEREGASQAAE